MMDDCPMKETSISMVKSRSWWHGTVGPAWWRAWNGLLSAEMGWDEGGGGGMVQNTFFFGSKFYHPNCWNMGTFSEVWATKSNPKVGFTMVDTILFSVDLFNFHSSHSSPWVFLCLGRLVEFTNALITLMMELPQAWNQSIGRFSMCQLVGRMNCR